MRDENVVAATPGGDLTEEHFIGRLATYTLPDEPQPANKLLRCWSKHGLDVGDLPDTRTPVHTFQSACRSVETRHKANGHSVEIKVDEAFHDKAACVYQITRMIRNREERVIEHTKSMTLSFDKGTGEITVTEMEDYDALRGIEEDVRSHFTKNEKRIPGQKLRNAIRDKIISLGGQNLRRKAGGLYFVPRTYHVPQPQGGTAETDTAPTLEAIKSVLDELYDGRADFYLIPLVGDEGQKQMVRKHFTLNVNEQLEELTVKAINRVRNPGERGVRQEMIDGLWNERRRMLTAIDDFKSLVGAEEQEIEANIKAFNEALLALEDFKTNGSAP